MGAEAAKATTWPGRGARAQIKRGACNSAEGVSCVTRHAGLTWLAAVRVTVQTGAPSTAQRRLTCRRTPVPRHRLPPRGPPTPTERARIASAS